MDFTELYMTYVYTLPGRLGRTKGAWPPLQKQQARQQSHECLSSGARMEGMRLEDV